VLDIGCGWGGMAIYLAQNYDVSVVGVTLSDEQHALAVERVKAAGLMDKIRDVLTDDGCALVHSIGRKGGPGTTGAWIRKYIFPGGYSPALSETFAEIEKSQLWVTDCEILRLHYAETLLEWDNRFQANKDTVIEMFDEKFARMWEFYLIVSEFSFRHGKPRQWQLNGPKPVRNLKYCQRLL